LNRIYLDNAATTAVHPQVFEKMEPFLKEQFGNPSSLHYFGREVKKYVKEARESLAASLNIHPDQLIFNSGGTEGDQHAIIGVALANLNKGKHLIISEIEHSAVMNAANFLKQLGFEFTVLPVDQYGKINLQQLKDQIRQDTILISIMYVNNEIGTIQDIVEIGNIAKEKGIYFHTDAVQAYPIIDMDLKALPIDLMTISSHKINGPKGIGALYVANKVQIQSLLSGTQEKGRRAGTENVPGIIGFGEAAKLLSEIKNEKQHKFTTMRKRMIEIWKEMLHEEQFMIHGHPKDVVPTILNVSFPQVDTQTMLMKLDLQGIAISGGSACASGAISVSRVIKALHLPDQQANSAVRISFGLNNTIEEIEAAAKKIAMNCL